jgi:hypothetical protein
MYIKEQRFNLKLTSLSCKKENTLLREGILLIGVETQHSKVKNGT